MFSDKKGDAFDFQTYKGKIDKKEKLIIQVFNNTYSCLRYRSNKNQKNRKHKSFFNRSFFLNYKSELNNINKIKIKKVFEIEKSHKENRSLHWSCFERSLEEIVKTNDKVLDALTNNPLSVESLIEELINKNEKIPTLMIDDMYLKTIFEKDITKFNNFFSTINNLQKKLKDKINNLYYLNIIETPNQVKQIQEDEKLENSRGIENLVNKQILQWDLLNNHYKFNIW